MKIIHLALGKANPERMNGVNKVVHQLATTQTDLGYDVTLWGITPNVEHNYPERNYETVLFPAQSNKLSVDVSLLSAIEVLSEEQRMKNEKTIFHLHASFIPEFFHLAKALQKNKIPYIYTPHGNFHPTAMERKSKWIKKIYFSLFEKKIIRGAKAVHLLGQTNFNHLNNLIYVNNKVLIFNGIGVEKVPSLMPPSNDQIVFGSCSRIDIHMKGLDILVQGYAKYIKEGGNGKLQIIGGGDELEALKSMAVDHTVAARVDFVGARYDQEKFDYLNRVDCFTQPSRNEGFPISVLEAASMSKPCLVSEETNVGSFIRQHEAGFVLQKNDPDYLAKEMHKAQHLFESRRLHLLGLNARQMVKERFTWNIIAKQFKELYEMPLDEWRILQSEKNTKQLA